MKKILILMCFVLPLTILAQTRPLPKKPNGKTAPKNENMRGEKPTNFLYMIMTVEEVKKSKKEETSTKFKFQSFDSRYSERLSVSTKNKTSTIEVLNLLGRSGWELVSVNNEHYYFKNRFLAEKR
tara:strand:+ start:333 stop:707 length:375 start_codon:yes stop_codon:yes gene_type:complete